MVSTDPYRYTKFAALQAVDERVRKGADVRVVFPGGVFGPAPCVESAMRSTSFNRLLRGALRGRLASAIAYSASWIYADDVAIGTIRAMDRNVPGERYLLVGRPEDEMSTAAWCNRAAEIAGVAHRVEEVPATDDPALVERFGPTLVELGRRRIASPRFDISRTVAALGCSPRPVDDALALTIAWFRKLGYI
jgi:nucleoside-diphosphate-sugar epimerase